MLQVPGRATCRAPSSASVRTGTSIQPTPLFLSTASLTMLMTVSALTRLRAFRCRAMHSTPARASSRRMLRWEASRAVVHIRVLGTSLRRSAPACLWEYSLNPKMDISELFYLAASAPPGTVYLRGEADVWGADSESGAHGGTRRAAHGRVRRL
jgi:hypothetical protein